MKKKSLKFKILNILFYIFVIIVLYLSIIFNKDYSIINGRLLINNEDSLNKYKEYKFVTLDLSKATETRFSINDNEKLKSNLYTINYGSSDVLVELSPSSVVTNKVDLIYNRDTQETLLLKQDLKNESENEMNFVSGYYTNINLQKNEDLINIKMTITKIMIFVCFALACIYFVFFVADVFIKRDY